MILGNELVRCLVCKVLHSPYVAATQPVGENAVAQGQDITGRP
jgi:hypothetical protein